MDEKNDIIPTKEPKSDRILKDVVQPPTVPLTESKLFPNGSKIPDLKILKEHLLKEGKLTLQASMRLIIEGKKLFEDEPNLLKLKFPITVCGDIHGQYFDLVRLFEVGGSPDKTQYLFLGDYVDRGCFSCEVVFYMYAMKINYPDSFFMLRGNHECRQLTSFFNFKDECLFKYNNKIYDTIMDSFDCLPLAAVVNDTFFCVHGGLSPDITSLEDIEKIDRFDEIPRSGPMCDLLWSDPYDPDNGDDETSEESDTLDGSDDDNNTETNYFTYNETRQCSFVYGIEAVKQFLNDNNLTSVIRAHEARVDGYKMHMKNNESGIPRVITIFSAPNYCDVYKNKAACLKFDKKTLNIKQFVEKPHPYYLPNFMDVFQWSLPFVAEKVTDMLANILDYGDSDSEEEDEKTDVLAKKGGRFKKKVMAVTRVMRMFKTLRQESENITQLKQLSPNNRVPFGLLQQGPKAIAKAIGDFVEAKKADLINEKRPGIEKKDEDERKEFVLKKNSSFKGLKGLKKKD